MGLFCKDRSPDAVFYSKIRSYCTNVYDPKSFCRGLKTIDKTKPAVLVIKGL